MERAKKRQNCNGKGKNALTGCRIATARAERKPYIEQNGRAYYNEEKCSKREGRPHGTGISARTVQRPSCGLDERAHISQPELAKEIGCSKSTISRFISGAKGTLTHEQVLKIARLFNVSTDFLLGETNIPDRKNYDIAELGLSVEAAKNLYTGRVNTEVVNLLLENARFAELTYRIAQYFDDTFASGIAAQNAMLTTLSTLLRTKVKTPEAAKAAKDISLRRKPVYQGDLDDIEMYFMAAVKEIKNGYREPLRRTGSYE